ncbi:MAG: hypothetical protein PVF51_10660 [Nitrospirota bacterium]|jgi:hypothetical protein
MAVRLPFFLVVVLLAVGQMGGCEIRFNGVGDSSAADPVDNTTGRGTTADETIDISGLRLSVDGSTLGEMVEDGEDVIYGTVFNNSGSALAGILVKVTLNLTSGGEESLSVPLIGQTVSRNDKTASSEKIVSDGLYATATGLFRIATGRSPDEIEPVETGDFIISFSNAGVSEPDSSVIFPEDGRSESTDGTARRLKGTVENDGDRTTFNTEVIWGLQASDDTLVDIRRETILPTDGGTGGRLAAGATGRFDISVETADLGQLQESTLFRINWTEEE